LAAAGLFVCTLPAQAQINVDSGKSAAQIFASTCNACHRSPREVRPTTAAFLREHYTAGSQEAAAMAAYLAAIGSDPAAVKRRPPPVMGAGQPPPAQRAESDKGPQGSKPRRPSESMEVGRLSDPALTQTAAVGGSGAGTTSAEDVSEPAPVPFEE
jgi:hypothetical protein